MCIHINRKKIVSCLFIIILFLPFNKSFSSEKLHNTETVRISKDYQSFFGIPVGEIYAINGRVIIIHADSNQGYIANQHNHIFNKDTIITKADSKICIYFKDGSKITSGPLTKFAIDRVKIANDLRSFFVSIESGIIVVHINPKKFYKYSELKIKSKFALISAEKGEYVIKENSYQAIVSNLGKFRNQLICVTRPDLPSIWMLTCEARIIEVGGRLSQQILLSENKIKRIKKIFTITPSSLNKTIDADSSDLSGEVIQVIEPELTPNVTGNIENTPTERVYEPIIDIDEIIKNDIMNIEDDLNIENDLNEDVPDFPPPPEW